MSENYQDIIKHVTSTNDGELLKHGTAIMDRHAEDQLVHRDTGTLLSYCLFHSEYSQPHS